MSLRVRCLSCGHRVDLGEAYEDYEGDVRCWTCNAMFAVSIREGRLRWMRSQLEGRPGATECPPSTAVDPWLAVPKAE